MSIKYEDRIVETTVQYLVITWDEDTDEGDKAGDEACAFSADDDKDDPVSITVYRNGCDDFFMTMSRDEVEALRDFLDKALAR
jgi:hypothetical protein